MEDDLLNLYRSENFTMKYNIMKKYNMPLAFDAGRFGEYLACILFNTTGTGVSTGWDTESKLECKTGIRVPPSLNQTSIDRGSIRWGITPKTHKLYKNEQSSYVFTYMDFSSDHIRTTVGTLNPKDPKLNEFVDIAKSTLNLRVWGQTVYELPIRIVADHKYLIHEDRVEKINENLGSTTYFGRETGRQLKNTVGKPRGYVKR